MPGFFNSAKYPFKGIQYLFKHSVLFKYIFFALIIDLALSAGMLYFFWSWLSGYSELVKSWGDAWYISVVKYFLKTSFVILMILIFPFALTLISAIVDPFFRSKIYEKTRALQGAVEPERSFKESFILALKSVCTELKKLLFYLFLSAICLILNLFLGLGIVLQVIVTATFLGWEFLGPHLEEKKLSFTGQLSFVWSNFRLVTGFGFSAMALLFIPVAQALFLSTHTIGAALLSLNLDEKK